jgi:hypothetical protein
MTLQYKEGRASDVQCGVYPTFAFHVFTSRARMRRPVGLHHTPGSARGRNRCRRHSAGSRPLASATALTTSAGVHVRPLNRSVPSGTEQRRKRFEFQLFE